MPVLTRGPIWLMNAKCDILRAVMTKGTSGSVKLVYSNIYPDTICRIQPRSGEDKPLWSRDNNLITLIVYFLGGTDVIEGDWLQVGSDNYSIASVLDFDHEHNVIAVHCTDTKGSTVV